MNRILLFCTTLLTLSAIRPYAQLTAPAATVTQMTNYTNGAAPDPVYIFCDPGPSGNPTPASLTAIPPGGPAGWKFEWFIYNQATNSWNVLSTENNVPSSTITNLASGGYRVVVTDGNNVVQGCFRAWVWHKRTVLNINPLTAGCQPFTINGALQTDNSFTYYNPPPDPFIVGPNTTVTVCFSANHTYVSDLGFFLIGPASCGSPTVPLAPHPQAINAANGCCCNANDNVNNLCFSTNNNNLLAVCGAAAPLTGNFGIYGQGVPNNYNTNNNNWGPIFGCDATQGGWSVQIYDCIAQDVGALTNATISFSGNASCGPSNIVYNSGNINSVINDNSCNPQTASIYTVPPPPPTVAQTINTADTYTWTSSPALPGFPVAGTAFPLNINPVPQQDTWFYFTVTNSIGCVRVDSVFFDYVAPDEPTITIPAVFCYDSPARVLAADLPGGVWSGTGIADPATGLFDPVAAGAGAHQVIYTMPPPCGKADTVTVTVSSRTILNGVAVPSTCFGADNGSINVAVTSGSLPLTASWNTVPVQNTVSAAGLPPGNHTLTVQNTHGCIQTFDFATTEPTQIILAMNTVDVNCPGGNNGQATVTAQGGTAPYAYSWNTVPPQTAGNATALAAGSYTVTVTDGNLCTAQADADIQTLSIPPTIGGAVTEESCAGVGDGAIGLNVSGGTGPFTYVWDSGQTTQDIAQLGGGTYTVTLTDVYACTYTQPFNVAAGNAFAFTFSVTDVLCKGDNTGSIQVSPVSGNPPYTYLLNGTPGPPAQYDGLPAGNYNVQVTDDRGCDTVYLALIDEPLLALTAAVNTVDVNCPGGNNGQATVTAQGGTAPYAYSWNTVPPQTAGNATALAAGSYTVTVTDDHLCTAQADADIQTLSVPPTIGGAVTEESCAGVGDGAIGLNVSGGTGPFTYAWDSGQTTQDIAQLGGGTYTVTLTDVYACTYTQPFNVAAGNAFAFTFSVTDVLCKGDNTGSIQVSPVSGNPPYTYLLNGTPGPPAQYEGLPAGNYNVQVTDDRGCDTVYLALIDEPLLALTAAVNTVDVNCPGGNNGQATVTAQGGTAPYAYSWNTVPPQTAGNATALAAGSYTVTVTDDHLCTAQADADIQTLSVPPTIGGAVTEESCDGVGDGAIDLNVSGGTGPFTYVWDSGQTTQDIAQLGGGTYTVTLTDVYACTYTQPFNVAAGSAFAFNFSTVPVLCHGESTGNILLSPLTGNPPYTYFLDGTVVSPDRYSHLPAGNYTVRVTDSRGCDTVYLASLTEPPAVFADSTHEQIRLGDHLNLNPQIGGGTGNLTITWTPPRNIDCDRCINPLAWPTQSTVYYITVTDQNGCTETGRVFVEVFHDGPFIPNAFTPGNRDELNSRWGVSDYGVRDFELMVFDRWGNRLFRSDNIYEGWDGMAANGILCEGGMYVYKTRITYIDGTEKTMLGHVTLLR